MFVNKKRQKTKTKQTDYILCKNVKKNPPTKPSKLKYLKSGQIPRGVLETLRDLLPRYSTKPSEKSLQEVKL